MNINQFIQTNQLRPADAIVVRKLSFGLLKHYVIYMGQSADGQHWFMANVITAGIKLISPLELNRYLNTYAPVEINRFRGNEYDRQVALNRAWERRGEQEYNLIINNCEHFKNYVHTGIPKSKQVAQAGLLLTIAGTVRTIDGLAKKNNNGVIAGLLIAGAGLLTVLLEEDL